jgi:histidine triad (HIT) family protein
MATQEKSMHHHAPPDYVCPFCLLVQGKESSDSPLKQTDIVFQSADVTAFMATRKYPNNQGHVLIVPNEHYENIYDLPPTLSSKIHALSRDIALSMKTEYQCNGILPGSTMNRQEIRTSALSSHVIRYQTDGLQCSKLHLKPMSAKYAQTLRDGLVN